MNAPSPKPGQLISVIVGEVCRGFLFRRRGAFEAFDINEKSLGTFADAKSAVAALFDPNPERST